MDQLTSVFASQPNDKNDLLSKYQSGGSSSGSSGSIFGGGGGSSNKSVFDNISSYGKHESKTENAFMSSKSAFSDIGHGMNLEDSGMNGIYEEKGSLANMLNIKAGNQTQLSLTNSLRGLQAKRLDNDRGEVSIAEMYNDSSLDTRAGGGRYNITITDIYKDKKLFMGFHGLHTDGKIDDNDVDITNKKNESVLIGPNQSLTNNYSIDNNEVTTQVDTYKKIEIVNAWDKKSEWQKDTNNSQGNNGESKFGGVSLMSIPAGAGFIVNQDSRIKSSHNGDGFKGDIRHFSNTGISEFMNEDKPVKMNSHDNEVSLTNEWNKKSLWSKDSKSSDSNKETKKTERQIIKGGSGYEIKGDKKYSENINEAVDEIKKNDFLDEEVSKIKTSLPSPNIIDYNNYIENMNSDFILNVFEYNNVKIGSLDLSELINLKERVVEEQKTTLNTDHYIIIYDNITRAIIKKSF